LDLSQGVQHITINYVRFTSGGAASALPFRLHNLLRERTLSLEAARGAAAKHTPIIFKRHPLGARWVAIEGSFSTIRILLRIDVQHKP
jgi:hypothetical protein